MQFNSKYHTLVGCPLPEGILLQKTLIFMNNKTSDLRIVNSISEIHQQMGLPKPKHPLISVIQYADATNEPVPRPEKFLTNFYMVCIKKDYQGTFKYGQQYYDFSEGAMTFIAPKQVIFEENADENPQGTLLLFHPDLIQGYSLAKKIHDYGFFTYEANEALHLSEGEEAMIEGVMNSIAGEYQSPVDTFSQDVIISQLELLLNYSNRFYHRQFITRHQASKGLLAEVETLLNGWFQSEQLIETGVPTVQEVAQHLNMSPNYLSDMLRTLTGQTTQQHIHNALIEKAKEQLSTTALPISEIAYQLGFEYSQSFSKLFKNKTDVSPSEFRASFN